MTNARFLSMTQPHAAGSLLSTVDDLEVWDEALFSGKVVSADSFQRMTTRGILNNGEEHDYGYGLMIMEVDGKKLVGHGGGIFGFVTFAARVVDENLFVAVFSNGPTEERSPQRVAQKFIRLVLDAG